ncbi:hypothetical protein [Streptomyces sp. P17]|uniref:hypothetical protein n=1 Tax=Streptomyces sp. P17 TaxID=3074716 RepID=UPI0028F447AB|nr:hypothetical protein [Streptomyces sp. P17]MDT9695311.1 hypothetical protein [Streptomyces sp. P17]
MTAEQPLTYDAFVELATADSAVVGLVLKGSRAHDGMITRHSDHDLYVIIADDAPTDLTRFGGHRTADLDLVIVSLTQFRAAGMPGFERYALARAHILLDRLDGDIAQILADKARLNADEAFQDSRGWLDAYANSLYRSLKNHRDGRPLAARLDAADSIRYLLELLFTLDRRPRPYNKYLEWELVRHPLPGWDTDVLLHWRHEPPRRDRPDQDHRLRAGERRPRRLLESRELHEALTSESAGQPGVRQAQFEASRLLDQLSDSAS